MVSVGLKALPSRKHTLSSHNSSVADKRKMGRKDGKKRAGYHGGDASSDNHRKFSTGGRTTSAPEASFVRKQVDPETVKYFSEISNVIEGEEMESEERSVICGNALEEAKGREVELATDYIISHTMQTLLGNCSVDHLCSFLQGCGENFIHISMDRSGSHVAETALKSLSRHLEDDENDSLIEDTLSFLCQAIASDPVSIMCNCHGSHVLRRLLCLCKGVSVDSLEFHSTNPSMVLAERLNMKSFKQNNHHETHQNQSFSVQLKVLTGDLVNPLRVDIEVLQKNQYSSLVLQTALRLLTGEGEELSRIIPIILGCRMENASDGNFLEFAPVKKILRLAEDNAFSHLMEVILAVSPDTIYNDILTKVFKDTLFRLSSHSSGNFVVQALISHARNQEHIKLIFEELGSKFRNLLELGRSGVVAALIAASERLQTLEQKCCQALADAVCSTDESCACIVPRILFLDNYLFYAGDKGTWNWSSGGKMNVLGSLILQTIFRFAREFIQPYITSITSLEETLVLEASKNTVGARVIEAFLVSSASPKQKHKLAVKLRGHFGELSVLPSGSFTVEKCFSVSNLSLRETIVSELVSFQTELSKTRQGPYLLKNLDVEGFARSPDQWRSRQTSKQSAYQEFYESFGPKDTKSSRTGNFLSGTHRNIGAGNLISDTRQNSQAEKLKDMRKEIDNSLSSGYSNNSGAPFLAHQGSTKSKKLKHSKEAPGGRGFRNDDNSDKKKRRKIS